MALPWNYKQITKKDMDEYLASLRPGHVLTNSYERNASNQQDFTSTKAMNIQIRGLLKGITHDGQLHLRPLCAPGDLLLALNDLLDDSLFEEAVVQIPDNPTYELKKGKFIRVEEEFTSIPKGVDKLFFRLTHKDGHNDKWSVMRLFFLFI